MCQNTPVVLQGAEQKDNTVSISRCSQQSQHEWWKKNIYIYLYRILWGMSIDMYILKCIPIFLSTVGWNIFCLVSPTCPGLSQGRPWSVKQRKPRSERRSLELSSGQMHGHIVQWSFLVYSANWGVICYLPPIKGTRKLHWYCRYHLWPYDILFAVFFFKHTYLFVSCRECKI